MKTQVLKAIETSYKGYRFRSRLEARWAVFLDNIGVVWEYEKQGYNLGYAGYYLPDFWIDTWDVFIEIKPLAKHHREINVFDLRKMLELSKESPVFLVSGSPWIGEHKIYMFDKGRFDFDHSFNRFSYCEKCQKAALVGDGYGAIFKKPHNSCDHVVETSSYAYSTAYRAARSARFEYGETP